MKITLEGICLVVPQGYTANGSQHMIPPHNSNWQFQLANCSRGHLLRHQL